MCTFTGNPTAGKNDGELIVRIFCEPVNVTLLHTLYVESKFSSRPLELTFCYYLNKTIVGHIHRDGFVYAGITLFETYRPGQVIVSILDHFYVFQTYF